MSRAGARTEVAIDRFSAVILRDLGPWDRHPSVTNDAEAVVASLAANWLGGRRLLYVDTDGRVDELTYSIVDGRATFTGFRPGYPTLEIAIAALDVIDAQPAPAVEAVEEMTDQQRDARDAARYRALRDALPAIESEDGDASVGLQGGTTVAFNVAEKPGRFAALGDLADYLRGDNAKPEDRTP